MNEYRRGNTIRDNPQNHFEAQFCPVRDMPYDDKLSWAALTRLLRDFPAMTIKAECFNMEEVNNLKQALSEEQRKRVIFTWLVFPKK